MRDRVAQAFVLSVLVTACASQGGSTPTQSETVTSRPPSASVSATPELSGLTGHLVFTRAGGEYGDETTFVARIDGSDEVQLSELGSSCCASAARDGSRVAFNGQAPDGRFAPVLTNLDGSEMTVMGLPDDGLNYSGILSYDGTMLVMEAFSEEEEGAPGAGTYVATVDGSTMADLRMVSEEHFIPGGFSPDNAQVLLFKNEEGGESPLPGILWLMDASGENLRQVTPDDVPVQCCGNYRFSDDGSKILFADSNGVLWTIAPDGSQLEEVYRDPDGRYAITPDWSPDGTMIVFGLDPAPDPFEHPPNAVYVVREDGSGLTQLFDGGDFKREFAWVSE